MPPAYPLPLSAVPGALCRAGLEGAKEHHHAVPRAIARERKQAKKEEKGGQRTLDGVFHKASKPNEFSRDVVLKAVAEFVVCDDQVRTSICCY